LTKKPEYSIVVPDSFVRINGKLKK
jgi:hypothetical protein